MNTKLLNDAKDWLKSRRDTNTAEHAGKGRETRDARAKDEALEPQ